MPHLIINGIVAARDKRPYVQVDMDGKLMQLSIAEARKVAMDLLTTASYAEADAMFHQFFAKMDFPEGALGALMVEFRDFRHELAMQTVESTFSSPDEPSQES